MKVIITEKQFRKLVNQFTDQALEEEDVADTQPTGDAAPAGGTSKSDGYPEVHKWESGVSRGAANQIGNTKWVDAPNTQPKRDKANTLN